MSNRHTRRILIFIGGIAVGFIPTGGETAKNYNLLTYFKEIYDEVIVCDTLWWRKNPKIIFKIIYVLLANPKATVFISASARSVDRLIKIIPNGRLNKHVFYSTIGGVFHELVHEKEVDIDKLQNIRRIIVESDDMRRSLKNDGFTNVLKIPNVKNIKYYPSKVRKTDSKTHFVFLSRITSLKGCDLIFDSVEQLTREGLGERFDITFYGHIDNYQETFESKLKLSPQCRHAGIIDLTKPESYDELANFDVMLFPTFWPGEGFPGVLVDAFIASLPVIASTWHYNAEIISDNVNGLLIPPKDVEALTDKMRYLIENPHEIVRLSIGSRNEAEKYDIKNVYSIDFMREIGML